MSQNSVRHLFYSLFMRNFFLNEQVIMTAIAFNIAILFLLSFEELGAYFTIFDLIDHGLTVFFLLEMLFKVRVLGWKTYIRSGWNQMDFVIVVLTTPSLILYFFEIPNLTLLIVLRLLRLIKFFRFLQFVPNLDQILKGLSRALKASVFVFAAFFLYILVISLFTCYLYKDIAPEYFGNAFRSFYTIFRLFTLEGWNEIPDEMLNYPAHSNTFKFFSTLYFVGMVITGGVFGLSLVNAIFIDEMISDNNDDLENRITDLESKIDFLIDDLQKNPL